MVVGLSVAGHVLGVGGGGVSGLPTVIPPTVPLQPWPLTEQSTGIAPISSTSSDPLRRSGPGCSAVQVPLAISVPDKTMSRCLNPYLQLVKTTCALESTSRSRAPKYLMFTLPPRLQLATNVDSCAYTGTGTRDRSNQTIRAKDDALLAVAPEPV
jgi:hypothetical protein